MPAKSYIYALPYEFYEQDKVRRYGFHGTSHKYVSQRAAAMLGKPAEELKLISCHLGNGSSVTAIDGGKMCIRDSLYLGGEVVDAATARDSVSQLTHIVGGLCGAGLGFAMGRGRRI